MVRKIFLALALTGPAAAHHGWGSYAADTPITVAGPILTSKYENPHATITVRGQDKQWTVTLAPTSRMNNRGAVAQLLAVGKEMRLPLNQLLQLRDDDRNIFHPVDSVKSRAGSQILLESVESERGA